MSKKTRQLLTREKAKWAKNRDVNLLGFPLNYNAAVQSRYRNRLIKLVDTMIEETKKEIIKLFKSETAKEYFAQDESIASQSRILTNELTSKFDQLFSLRSKILSKILIEQTLRASKSSLHASLEHLSGGLSLNTGIITTDLKEKAKSIIAENVNLIESIPKQYFKNITGAVMRSISQKGGLKDLIKQISKYSRQSKRHVELLAMDQTRKAYNTINAERLKTIGIKQFKWLHSSGSQYPRESHIKISGEIFSFENLINEQKEKGVPEKDRGLPGIPINCKCVLGPVFNFEKD